jgi:hypothetical protein
MTESISKAGDDRTPAWLWQGYLYKDENNVAMPYENIMTCIRQASAQMILKGNKTYKEISQSGLSPLGEFAQFFCDGKQIDVVKVDKLRDLPFEEQMDGARKLGFQLWLKRARIGQAKHIRVRPRFNKWSVKGELSILRDDILTKDVLNQIFDIAGRTGLGDWRPGCKTPGSYGMFKSTLKFS